MRQFFSLLVFLLSASCIWGQAQNNIIPQTLPVNRINQGIAPEMQYSGHLEFLLQEEINKNSAWKKLIANKRMSIGIVDLSDVDHPTYASVNGDHMMYAASLPKIAVLLAAMEAIDEGRMELTPKIQQDMWLMISKSNNAATTRMIDRVGFEGIAKTVQAPENQLYNKENGGGIWVGKRYAAAGKRNPDPLKGLSHAATANTVLEFYKKMAYGELVSIEKSKEMLQIMMNPSLHHKFVNTLDKINPSATVFRKSGSWKNFHSDSALVWGPDGRKYILVALIEDAQGGLICKQLVKNAENVISNNRPAIAISN